MARCVIIDDEPLSRDVLRKYIGRVKDLNLVGECPDAFEATHFLKAVNRALERLGESHVTRDEPGKILLKADKKLYAIEFSRILYVEGQGDYIRVCLDDRKLVVHDTIKNFLASLPEEKFLRIHKSYIVHLDKIECIEGNQVRIGDHTIPVSPASREELLNRLSSRNPPPG